MNKAKLILHIGTTKTGTSSFQRILATNQKFRLEKFSIWYPTTKKLQGLLENVNEGNDDAPFIGGGNFPKKVRSALKSGDFEEAGKLLEVFFAELSQQEAEVILISSEALLGTFGSNQKFADFLSSISSKYFESTEIICVVRPPLDHTVSQYSEYVKRRRYSTSFDESCLKAFLDIGAYIEPFFKSFGPSNVKIIPYTNANQGKSLIGSLLSAINSEFSESCLSFETTGSHSNVNRSMSVLECEAAASLNLMMNKFQLNRVLFVKSYNRYMSKYQKDTLVKYHYLSEESHDSLLQLSNSSLSKLSNFCGLAVPFSSPGLAKSMLDSPRQRDDICRAKYNEIMARMLHEIINI